MDELYTSKTTTPIDLNSALERVGGDESFLYELISIYTQDFSEKFQKLQQAVESGDFETIRELGHNLKGSSANLSLIQLQHVSYDMEESGKDKDIEKAQKSLVLLDEEFRRLQDYLAQKNNTSAN
jgi:HPt (histidine-containing phosphotransfer) domain-containing protein